MPDRRRPLLLGYLRKHLLMQVLRRSAEPSWRMVVPQEA